MLDENGIEIGESTDLVDSSAALAVGGLAVEAAIASADEAQQRDEELRVWLDERFNTNQAAVTELQNSQLSTRESLMVILERLTSMLSNQQTQTELLTSANSTLQAVQQSQQNQLDSEEPEIIETVEVEPEATEPENQSSEDGEGDNLEQPTNPSKTRQNTIRKV